MDAWKQEQELLERFTQENMVRPDLRVTGLACDRSVELTLIEYDFTMEEFDKRHKKYHSTRRNVATMRELAEGLLAACDFVEESNPEWAKKPDLVKALNYSEGPKHRPLGEGWCSCGSKTATCDR